ncbi:kelch protein [Holotrichia oblita]|uniref:Kelch protein n=1 Tax=Holotrichia oblita TaxID=644536 RepID=A0ACB9TK40_HOLOL|nr:kelch protein [Holotrichia oblita]
MNMERRSQGRGLQKFYTSALQTFGCNYYTAGAVSRENVTEPKCIAIRISPPTDTETTPMEFSKQSEGDFTFLDEDLERNTLSALNMMRKNRHFCDVILHVGNIEIHAHRAVLASVSPYLFELFSSDQEQKRNENVITYKMNGGFEKGAFQLLVDYAYTAQLEIPGAQFDQIKENSYLLNLRCVRIEVLNQSKEEMTMVNTSSLCRLVLDWIRKQITEDNLGLTTITENTFMLYLAIDNSLQDCNSLPTGDVCDTELVQDYKKLSSKNVSQNKSKRKQLSQPSKPRVLIYSREIGEELESEMEPHWNLIASTKVGEHSYIALVTLAGKLAKLSIKLRLNVPTTPSPVAAPEACKVSNEEKPDMYYTLANMSCPRCAVGCGNLNNTLLVCGGYDRIECLRSVEQYIPDSNKWSQLKPMRQGRGRFQIAILGDKVYAIGGSNGTTELDTVEMLDLNIGKWIDQPRLPLARSNPGVCDLNDLIYCIGGWNGQVGIKQCDVFDPKTSRWSSISSLNVGRYQAGVASYNNLVYAVGGCDAWNCLNSVETYDPETDLWTMSKPLITARRGCGVTVFNNKLYVVGGSDGSHTLNTTEIYDKETKTWEVGPCMTVPRANVEVAVVGDRLYAVGGFSGKSFLNTIEYLDLTTNEWTNFIPNRNGDTAAPTENGTSS